MFAILYDDEKQSYKIGPGNRSQFQRQTASTQMICGHELSWKILGSAKACHSQEGCATSNNMTNTFARDPSGESWKQI